MCAADVAARGLDVPNITHVINCELDSAKSSFAVDVTAGFLCSFAGPQHRALHPSHRPHGCVTQLNRPAFATSLTSDCLRNAGRAGQKGVAHTLFVRDYDRPHARELVDVLDEADQVSQSEGVRSPLCCYVASALVACRLFLQSCVK